ncbi:hypothetical protein FLONG3_4371 [Fusarium longipes]|uniref:Uncharacterized protein n=1 Tax=Fusarium longipes TaxID=694270 RepID=A0A395SZF6_9HYPO|nr:hypothetical protein FLONG3_4371 [Fusarium longipes]
MSAEPASTGVAMEENNDKPAKKSSHKYLIDKRDEEAIKAKRDQVIGLILPTAKNHPEIYESVVKTISKVNLRYTWCNSPLNRDFLSWSRVASSTERPNLVWFLACLATHDSFGKPASTFKEMIEERKLRGWAIEQLQVPRPSLPAAVLTSSQKEPHQTPQQAPRAKIEQRENDDPSGLKRPTPRDWFESINKRVLPSIEDRPAALPTQPQRIILRDSGTQTDDFSSLGDFVEDMKQAVQDLKAQTETLKEHNKMLMEHNRALVNQQMTPYNNAQQQQMQMQTFEVVPSQPANRGPSFVFDPSQGSGSNRAVFRFG